MKCPLLNINKQKRLRRPLAAMKRLALKYKRIDKWKTYEGLYFNKIVGVLLVAALACGLISSASSVPAAAMAARQAAAASVATEEPQSWLLKWSDPAQAHELRGTLVLRRQMEAAVELVRPADAGADVEAWLLRLRSTPGVEYVQPNQSVHILNEPSADETADDPAGRAQLVNSAASNDSSKAAVTKANDPELVKQHYLKQIGAQSAWGAVREQTDLTIAIVDTGIDLDHPDLKGNLVPGTNLVHPNEPPDDDNGHGTSVAGVIAATGNNGIGVSGILWKAKLMPIKALDYRGDGTEQELGEAILYAVRKQAKIVVLSVGLHRYSPYMLDIVQYAENKGVLLVAAAGNDGNTLGDKAAVKYPAAYSTVLAVGGVRSDNMPDSRSNPGSELDISAPWNVYTTAMGGRYKKEEGTSMAAPQVAAAAALIWARYPELKPYQVRALLRQSAKDVGKSGFDNESGYGVLQIDKAVTSSLKADDFESNDSRAEASRFPLFKQISAMLDENEDRDWYAIEAPYDGTLTIQFEAKTPAGRSTPPILMSHYTGSKLQKSVESKLGSRSFEFKVNKGKQYIRIQHMNKDNDIKLPYLLTSSFRIAPDAYESNDKSYEAYTLQSRSQSIFGTFHQTADRDWYTVTFKQSGTLDLRLSTNTVRIDPGLAIQKAGQTLMVYDDQHEGDTEQSPTITVTPGKYYIRVHNAISSEASPTIGTYTLKMDYIPKYEDPNEPNDKYYESLRVSSGTEYVGVIGSAKDVDWFQLRLSKKSIVDMRLIDVPAGRVMKLQVYDKKQKLLFTQSSGSNGKLNVTGKLFNADVYYVKLTADEPFDKQYYRFRIDADELVSGFRDIGNHWARPAIISMNKLGIASGTGSYTFEPNRSITRAESVAMAVKAYKPSSFNMPNIIRFEDMNSKHWAYGSVIKAVQQGWVKGFPDHTFKPDQPITRVEMAVIIGLAEGVEPVYPIINPFADVQKSHWAAPMLYAMKLKGYVNGEDNNQFNPGTKASRAEFTTLLYRVYK